MIERKGLSFPAIPKDLAQKVKDTLGWEFPVDTEASEDNGVLNLSNHNYQTETPNAKDEK
jgi:hypothetical protein